MASAQTNNTGTLADRVVVLEEYIKKQKTTIRNKQIANTHLTEVNKQLTDANVLLSNSQDLLIRTHNIAIMSAHNYSVLSISKTDRIRATNRNVQLIMDRIHEFPEVQGLLNKGNVSNTGIMVALNPLLTVWSQGKTLSHFLPNAPAVMSKNKARPIFTYTDVEKRMDLVQITNKLNLSEFIWRYSVDMHHDIRSFTFLKEGQMHNTTLHGYLAMVLTCYLYNIYKQHPVWYTEKALLYFSYEATNYQELMSENSTDLEFTVEPVRIRDLCYVDLQAQILRPQKKKLRRQM